MLVSNKHYSYPNTTRRKARKKPIPVEAADERFRAIDLGTGETLWETLLPTSAMATPMTYAVDGKQYVVVAAGGSVVVLPRLPLTALVTLATASVTLSCLAMSLAFSLASLACSCLITLLKAYIVFLLWWRR